MHSVHIDLSNNTDAGFYAAGNEYQVAIVGAVVDTKTVNVPLASFSIERANGILALLKSGTFGLSALKTLIDAVDDLVDTEVAAIKSDTAAILADTGTDGVVLNAAGLAADAVAEIADAVWDEDATGHQTTGTFGQAIGDPVADTNTIYKAVVTDATGATVGVDVVAVKADTAAILVDTGTTLDGRIPAALTANGNMKSSLMEILTTALTETVGQIAGAFKKFFDKAAPTGTINSLPDAVAGAASGVAIVGSNMGTVASVTGAVGSVTGLTAATVHSDLDDIQGRLPAALTAGGNIKADALAWNALATVALPLVPTVAGRTLDVSAGGEAGVDWANIGSPTTAVDLSGTRVLIHSGIKKNVAMANFKFLMTDSTNHAPATGLTVTVTRAIDGGAFAAGTLSAVTEVAFGIYRVDFGAGDLNGDNITFRATAAASSQPNWGTGTGSSSSVTSATSSSGEHRSSPPTSRRCTSILGARSRLKPSVKTRSTSTAR